MAYELQKWNAGDVITAEKLNHIEDGIVNSEVLEIEVKRNEDKTEELEVQATWREIYDAMNNDRIVSLAISTSDNNDNTYIIKTLVKRCEKTDEGYTITTNEEGHFEASSLDDFLVTVER